jgi:hypothetical protein
MSLIAVLDRALGADCTSPGTDCTEINLAGCHAAETHGT